METSVWMPGFCFIARYMSSGCSATPSSWPATRPGMRPGGPWEEKWGARHVEPRAAQHLAPHAPVEAADAAAGRAQALALEVGRGLDVLSDRIDLRRPRREPPELPGLHAAADRDIVDVGDGGALRNRGGRRRRFAAVELNDVGVDAVLGEKAELLGHIRGRMHHVGGRDRDPDIDLA